MPTSNTLLDSLFVLRKQEFCADLNAAYEWAKKELGTNFEPTMAHITAEILCLQGKCKAETSFTAAALMMMLPSEPLGDQDMSPADDAYISRLVRAALAWRMFEVWETFYGPHRVNFDSL